MLLSKILRPKKHAISKSNQWKVPHTDDITNMSGDILIAFFRITTFTSIKQSRNLRSSILLVLILPWIYLEDPANHLAATVQPVRQSVSAQNRMAKPTALKSWPGIAPPYTSISTKPCICRCPINVVKCPHKESRSYDPHNVLIGDSNKQICAYLRTSTSEYFASGQQRREEHMCS